VSQVLEGTTLSWVAAAEGGAELCHSVQLAVSHFCACTGSPCLRLCWHGASIGRRPVAGRGVGTGRGRHRPRRRGLGAPQRRGRQQQQHVVLLPAAGRGPGAGALVNLRNTHNLRNQHQTSRTVGESQSRPRSFSCERSAGRVAQLHALYFDAGPGDPAARDGWLSALQAAIARGADQAANDSQSLLSSPRAMLGGSGGDAHGGGGE
jgi:hypothetical protein